MAKTLQFKISLIDSDPLIWRQFKVTDDYRMDRLHQVLQIVMGWWNSHLHEFRISSRSIGMVDDNVLFDFPELEDETTIYLKDLSLTEGAVFRYVYDYGDNWQHMLEVEELSDQAILNPVCLIGERACPPEDCGGLGSYQALLEVIADPSHPEYEDWKDWLEEDFDPVHFPLDAVNKELERFGNWHRKHPRAKSTPWHQLY